MTVNENTKKGRELFAGRIASTGCVYTQPTIGTELADRLLEGKYSYVISTHIDKGHIHNHIIFCATYNIEHKKYNDCKRTYYHIRELNDNLRKEHNLSVINPSQNKGKSYKEWQAEKILMMQSIPVLLILILLLL